MLEREFQSKLIKEIRDRFPGCIILKNDPTYIQGFPDLTVLYGKHWFVLECKNSKNAHHQPNQDIYVKDLDGMSFARFIYPENKEEVLNEIQQAFKPRRKSRVSRSEQVSLD